MGKNVASYHADIDYEATLKRFQEYRPSGVGYSFEVTGGRGRAEAQIVVCFHEWNVSINIYPTGLIQIYYATLVNLRKAVGVLGQICVAAGKAFVLVGLDPDDPIDRSVELKTTYHFENTDSKYALATVLFFWWRNPQTDVFVCKVPDRDNKLVVPGKPFVFEGCVPISAHVIDKYDAQGNRIVTAEKLRRQAIEELKRIAREHPKVRFQGDRVFDAT